jgi:hypothetical protein
MAMLAVCNPCVVEIGTEARINEYHETEFSYV